MGVGGAKVGAVLTFTLPGTPLIYNGQEVGNDQRLAFFEKDPIVWKDNDLPQFYQQLNDLKANNPALWNGKFGSDFTMLPVANPQTVFAFTRENGDNKLVVAFNFSDEQASLQLSDVNERYTEYFSQEKRFFTPNTAITLAPWEYRVWMRH
jgi:glycosidase